MYPGGIEAALKHFDEAFEFALHYPFCSLTDSFCKRDLHIIDRDMLAETFPSLSVYKEFSRDALLSRSIREFLGKPGFE